MSNLDALLVFAKVAEEGSLSRAAKKLKMPLSTVSRKLAALESKLGARLIERSNRTLRLTEVGAGILDQAKQVAAIDDSIRGVVSDSVSTVKGRLRLSAPPSISDSLLVPIIGAFQTTYPEARVDVLITDRHVDHISEGVDLTFRVGKLKDSTLIARPILRYRHVLVASPRYLESVVPPEHPNELVDHPLLGFSFWTTKKKWILEANGVQEVVSFDPHLCMNDYTGLAAALIAGHGIGELPPIVCPSALEEGALVEVMPEWRFRPLELSLVHVSSRQASKLVRLFIECAAELAPKLFKQLPV